MSGGFKHSASKSRRGRSQIKVQTEDNIEDKTIASVHSGEQQQNSVVAKESTENYLPLRKIIKKAQKSKHVTS